MKTIQDFARQLTGQEITDALVEHMLEHVPDFREDHHRYLSAMNTLKGELGAPADRVSAAIRRRAAAVFAFSGARGLQMNWEHFTNSMAPNCTWPQVDYNDYLREDLACDLPQYREADAVVADFCRRLTPKQQKLYDVVRKYEAHLLTAGPKLAHYYGYLLGNTLLQNILPGYREDVVLTMKYNAMLAEYFGKDFFSKTASF